MTKRPPPTVEQAKANLLGVLAAWLVVLLVVWAVPMAVAAVEVIEWLRR